MSMCGHEVHSCVECNSSDYDCFMIQREGNWFCKDCDPGEELKQESLYDTLEEMRGER